MWIMTTFGFFSVVAAHGDNGRPHPTLRMIRARNLAHLQELRERFALPEIVESAGTDYPYRILADREVVTKIVMVVAEEIDYSNFKSEVKKQTPDDHTYLDFLHSVWAAGLHLTPRAELRSGFFNDAVKQAAVRVRDTALAMVPEFDLPELEYPPEHIGFKCNGDIRYPVKKIKHRAKKKKN